MAFDIYTGLGDFLDENEITSLSSEVLATTPLSKSLSVVLVLGVIAAGLHAMEGQDAPSQKTSSESELVFREACDRIAIFLLGHNSLMKLQVRTCAIHYALELSVRLFSNEKQGLVTLVSCFTAPLAFI